jgi:hypothetical protein
MPRGFDKPSFNPTIKDESKSEVPKEDTKIDSIEEENDGENWGALAEAIGLAAKNEILKIIAMASEFVDTGINHADGMMLMDNINLIRHRFKDAKNDTERNRYAADLANYVNKVAMRYNVEQFTPDERVEIGVAILVSRLRGVGLDNAANQIEAGEKIDDSMINDELSGTVNAELLIDVILKEAGLLRDERSRFVKEYT